MPGRARVPQGAALGRSLRREPCPRRASPRRGGPPASHAPSVREVWGPAGRPAGAGRGAALAAGLPCRPQAAGAGGRCLGEPSPQGRILLGSPVFFQIARERLAALRPVSVCWTALRPLGSVAPGTLAGVYVKGVRTPRVVQRKGRQTDTVPLSDISVSVPNARPCGEAAAGPRQRLPGVSLEAHGIPRDLRPFPGARGQLLVWVKASLVFHGERLPGGTPPQGRPGPSMQGGRPPILRLRPVRTRGPPPPCMSSGPGDPGHPRRPAGPTRDPSHRGDGLAFELKLKSHSCIFFFSYSKHI